MSKLPKGERPTISVVVVTYRRLATLERILTAWLEQTPDVWLADCSREGFKTGLPIKRVHFSPDPGNRARHAVALLTEGDLVIKADDDLLPKPGLIEDFIREKRIYGASFYGLIGRRFEGPHYYGETRFFRSSQVQEATLVDFVGVCTMAPRDFLSFDLKECATPIEDLFQQCGAFPKALKFVIPTKNYENLENSSEKGCLFKSPGAREARQAYYEQIWQRARREPAE